MRSGITTQALRRHRWSLLGPACTQVVAVTMNLATGRQLRDIGLLRSIGASPGQIRRSVALQEAVMALPASVIGTLLAVPSCALWLHALKAHGVVPGGVAFSWGPISIAASAGIVLATSVIASFLAALRTARLKPATALVEVGTGHRHIKPWRTIFGAMLVIAGAVLSIVLSTLAPSQMAGAGLFVMLAECIGVGLLSPILLRRANAVLRRLAPRGLVGIAADDLETLTRPLSGALVPLVLSTAFTAVKLGVHTTTQHVTGVADPAESRWMDYSGTATFCAFAGVAALNCFTTVVVARRGDLAAMRLAGAPRAAVVTMLVVQAGVGW